MHISNPLIWPCLHQLCSLEVLEHIEMGLLSKHSTASGMTSWVDLLVDHFLHFHQFFTSSINFHVGLVKRGQWQLHLILTPQPRSDFKSKTIHFKRSHFHNEGRICTTSHKWCPSAERDYVHYSEQKQ